MKRALTLLAALVVLTGCKICEAEYFDPTANGYNMFSHVNDRLTEDASDAARVLLFDLYYSAPEEERETIHNRYFYSSRIVGKGDEWRIIDTNRELVIRTDGQSLATDGATWKYAYTSRSYAEIDMPTISCRIDETGKRFVYGLQLPDNGGQLSLALTYCYQPQDDGTRRYWCELAIDGSGECLADKDYYGFRKIAYEITKPLRFVSNRPRRFKEGGMKLTAETDDDTLEAEVSYDYDNQIWIRCGEHENYYYYYSY